MKVTLFSQIISNLNRDIFNRIVDIYKSGQESAIGLILYPGYSVIMPRLTLCRESFRVYVPRRVIRIISERTWFSQDHLYPLSIDTGLGKYSGITTFPYPMCYAKQPSSIRSRGRFSCWMQL